MEEAYKFWLYGSIPLVKGTIKYTIKKKEPLPTSKFQPCKRKLAGKNIES